MRHQLSPGDGVGYLGPPNIKLSARNEQLCQLIERMDNLPDSATKAWCEVVTEKGSIRAFALAKKHESKAISKIE